MLAEFNQAYFVKSEDIKKELIRSRKDLEERLERIKKHIRHSETGIDPDFEDQATQRENDDVVDNLSCRLQKQLSQVRQALSRIDDGTYGICSFCGEPISSARLLAIPYTNICRKCASERVD